MAEPKIIEEIEYFPIERLPGHFVSKCGKVWHETRGNLKSYHFQKIGYNMFLKADGKPEYFHRVLAETFIPKIEGKTIVDHIDRNRINNNLNNLRWLSQQENRINSCINKNNSSGWRGVKKRETKKGTRYYTIFQGKCYGSFLTGESAYQKFREIVKEKFPNIEV